LLEELSRKQSCKTAIISGRPLADVKQKIGIEGLVYIGNHGLEIEGPGVEHAIAVNDAYLNVLQEAKRELQAVIHGYSGAFIEDKVLTLSVHFRLVDSKMVLELCDKVQKALRPYAMKNIIKARGGKMVYEIRPPVQWDKGKASLWLIERWQMDRKNDLAIPLYCGDDATDEDAFGALANKGITIVVGEHCESAAHYYLNTQQEINDLLAKINQLKR